MNCAAISAMLQSATLVKSYNSSEERIYVVSFKRTKANHDKLPCLNNSLKTRYKITLYIICIYFQVVFYENNFQEFGTLNAVCE